MVPIMFNKFHCAFLSLQEFICSGLGEGKHVLGSISFLLIDPAVLDADRIDQ